MVLRFFNGYVNWFVEYVCFNSVFLFLWVYIAHCFDADFYIVHVCGDGQSATCGGLAVVGGHGEGLVLNHVFDVGFVADVVYALFVGMNVCAAACDVMNVV